MTRDEALQFLRLDSGSTPDQVATLCGAWRMAFSMRAQTARTASLRAKFARLAERVDEAELVLLGAAPAAPEEISFGDGDIAGTDPPKPIESSDTSPVPPLASIHAIKEPPLVASPTMAEKISALAPTAPASPRRVKPRGTKQVLLLASALVVFVMSRISEPPPATFASERGASTHDGRIPSRIAESHREFESPAIADRPPRESSAETKNEGPVRELFVASTPKSASARERPVEPSFESRGTVSAQEARAAVEDPKAHAMNFDMIIPDSIRAVSVLARDSAEPHPQGCVSTDSDTSMAPHEADVVANAQSEGEPTSDATSVESTDIARDLDRQTNRGNANIDLKLSLSDVAESGGATDGSNLGMAAARAVALQDSAGRRWNLPIRASVEAGPGIALDLVLIPEGEFMMGSPDYEPGRFPDEGPLHQVAVGRPIFMGAFEVTRAQWLAVMGVGADDENLGPERPVTGVSWSDCAEFCDALSARLGMVVRLPREHEWEYACRSGMPAPYSTGFTLPATAANFARTAEADLAGILGSRSTEQNEPIQAASGGTFEGNSSKPTPAGSTSVGSFSSNAWGLFDMHGNVWEWCEDAYRPYQIQRDVGDQASTSHVPAADQTYRLSAVESGPAAGGLAPLAGNGAMNVLRGGSWGFSASYCRCAARVRMNSGSRSPQAGFRVVVEIP